MKKVRLGGGCASWGDALEPAVELAAKGKLDYIGMDHLGEPTMVILQRWKAKDPKRGFIPDIVPYMKALLPYWRSNGVKIVSNMGGVNPEACAEEVVKVAKQLGMEGLKIGIVLGDDIFPRIDELRTKGIKFKNLDTGEEDIGSIKDKIVAANAYTGSDSIIEALDAGADVVVAGRVSDSALWIGPCMYEFGWKYEPAYYNKIAAAITTGHAIECSAGCSGGMSSQWKSIPEPWKIAFPIAEIDENGDSIITKLEDAGGLVNVGTVKEHLLYELHDPKSYIMPDGIADFTTIKLEQVRENRVKLSNVSGRKRPDTLKVQMGYEENFIGEGHIWFPAPDAFEKAQWAEKWIRERMKIINGKYKEVRIDYLGVNTLKGKTATMPPSYAKEMNECGIRLAVKTETYEEANRLKRLVTWLWTHGPCGSSFGVPFNVRPLVQLWPTLVPRTEVPTRFIMKEVK